MIKFIYIILFFSNNLLIILGKKIFLESMSDLMSPSNWKSGISPCENDKILFPEIYPGALLLTKNLKADSLIFPKDGAIIFGKEDNIEFHIVLTNDGKQEIKNKNCKNYNDLALLKYPKNASKSWFDPTSWKALNNENTATPDLEKIPCLHDHVILPNNGSILIDFEDIDILELNSIEMSGVNTSWERFQNDLYSDLAHIMFTRAEDFSVIFNNMLNEQNICNCIDPRVYSDYEHRVCSHVNIKCEQNYPKCLNPIKPHGHCCEICGSFVKIYVDDCSAFDVKNFKKLIRKEIERQGLEKYLDFAASKVYDGTNYYVQLIVVDKFDYNELSVDFMSKFNKTFIAYKSNKKIFQLSGMKYDSKNPEHPWKFIFVPFISTILFFTFLYMYFVKGYIRLPSWFYQNNYGLFSRSFVFARFDNAQGELEISENIVISPKRVNILNSNDENLNPDISSSFDNPMFEEKLEVPCSKNHENTSIASGSTELTMIRLD